MSGAGALDGKVLKDTLLLNASSLVGQACSMTQAFLVLKLLEPAEHGLWQGVSLIVAYAAYASVGLEYGLGISLGYHGGRADDDVVRRYADTGFVGWTAAALLVAAGLVAYGVLAPDLGPVERCCVLLAAALSLAEQQIAFFLRWQMTARMDFARPSALAVVRSVVSLALVVPLARSWGVRGATLGSLGAAAVVAALWWRSGTYAFGGRVDRSRLVEMMRIGVPVLLVAIGGRVIETVDRVLILAALGPASLGYYGVTGLGGNALYGLVSQLGTALSPHIAAEAGRSQGSPHAFERFLVAPTLVCGAAMTAASMALVCVLPPLVERFLPKYVPGLPAFYLFVPGFFFLAVVLTANNILNMILIERRQQRFVVYIQIAGIAVEVLVGLRLLLDGWDITGMALASTLSYAFYGMAILGVTTWLVLPARRLRFLASVLLPFGYGVPATLGVLRLSEAWFAHEPLAQAIGRIGLGCVAIAPVAVWLETRVPFVGRSGSIVRRAVGRIIPPRSAGGGS